MKKSGEKIDERSKAGKEMIEQHLAQKRKECCSYDCQYWWHMRIRRWLWNVELHNQSMISLAVRRERDRDTKQKTHRSQRMRRFFNGSFESKHSNSTIQCIWEWRDMEKTRSYLQVNLRWRETPIPSMWSASPPHWADSDKSCRWSCSWNSRQEKMTRPPLIDDDRNENKVDC
jgi:hypothetical protein